MIRKKRALGRQVMFIPLLKNETSIKKLNVDTQSHHLAFTLNPLIFQLSFLSDINFGSGPTPDVTDQEIGQRTHQTTKGN